MPTLTIRNLPNEVIDRLKAVAQSKGHSMEQEVRELLETRYAARTEILGRIKNRWEKLPPTSDSEINEWLHKSRH